MSSANNTNNMTALEAKDVADLRRILRLPTDAEALAFLGTDQVREAFRIYRNRCLVSGRARAAQQLPDWKDIDEYLYEMQMSAEFRQFEVLSTTTTTTNGNARNSDNSSSSGGSSNRKQKKAKTTSADMLLDYVSTICREKPYDLKPHVAAFALRVIAFWDSRPGARFDVVGRGIDDDGGNSDALFDRYSRIMKLLGFLVARDN